MVRARVAVALAFTVFLCTPVAWCDDRPPQGHAHPTPLWAALQIIPSPGVVITPGGVAGTMEWQLTPVLYAYGVRRTVDPWRTFVVEPMVRTGGSVELFYAPMYVGLDGGFASRWGLRTGIRLTVPVVQHGDNVSVSLAASDLLFRDGHSLFVEAGIHVLYGTVGVTVAGCPVGDLPGTWLAGLHVRYF